MRLKKYFFLFLFALVFHFSISAQRNPLIWPFSETSIWNMPIGSEAVYIPAQLEPVSGSGMTVDEDLIIMTPEAPMQEIYTNYAGWNREKSRCPAEGPLLFAAPIPPNFIVSPETWDGLTPNSGLAVLMPDGKTIKQTQPFARCSPETATSQYVFDDENLYGDGYYGAHGGSGLSAIGGALRLGELDEPDDTIRHVLKINVYGAENLYYDRETKGYRWPARKADGYAASTYYSKRSNPVVKQCRMGALLALPAGLNLNDLQLETTPAKILARTFQDYGAYIVDDTAWDVYAIVTEWSDKGRVTAEFEKAWGFPMAEQSLNTPWTRDMAKIFGNLHVVENNGPETIGGGGKPRMPPAPPFLK